VPINARADILVNMLHTGAVHVDVLVVHTAADSFVTGAARAPGCAGTRPCGRRDCGHRGAEPAPSSHSTTVATPTRRLSLCPSPWRRTSAWKRLRCPSLARWRPMLRPESVFRSARPWRGPADGERRMYIEPLQELVKRHGRAYSPGMSAAVPDDT
jgi:hypothetical protein